MDAALAGLLGASVGAATGLFGGVLTSWQQRKGEAQRLSYARAADFTAELWKEERRALEALTTLLAKGTHEVVIFAWASTRKPIDQVKSDAIEYDVRMRALLPELSSAQALASGLSEEAFADIQPLVRRLLDLDGDTGTAIVQLESNPQQALEAMATFLEPARELENDIVHRLRSVLRGHRQLEDGKSPPKESNRR